MLLLLLLFLCRLPERGHRRLWWRSRVLPSSPQMMSERWGRPPSAAKEKAARFCDELSVHVGDRNCKVVVATFIIITITTTTTTIVAVAVVVRNRIHHRFIYTYVIFVNVSNSSFLLSDYVVTDASCAASWMCVFHSMEYYNDFVLGMWWVDEKWQTFLELFFFAVIYCNSGSRCVPLFAIERRCLPSYLAFAIDNDAYFFPLKKRREGGGWPKVCALFWQSDNKTKIHQRYVLFECERSFETIPSEQSGHHDN